jgi:hypothetical protein
MNTTKPATPIFESHTLTSLDRAKEIFAGRGTEYGDTWRDCQFLKMKAVAKSLGIEIDDSHYRALATAAFSDMKYWRLLGGYKDDSIIDGINYDAFLAEEMRLLTTKKYWCCVSECDEPSVTGSPFCPFHQPDKK